MIQGRVPGPAGAGNFFPTLNSNEQALFNQASLVLQEIDSVSGTIAGEPGSGLGPGFNGNSCTQRHAPPAPGGSSPGLNSPQNPIPNPQIALATLDSATDTVPSFVTANGPMLEARFVKNPNGTPDGGCMVSTPSRDVRMRRAVCWRSRTSLLRWRKAT